METITVSWSVVVAFIGVLAFIGPGFIWIGRLSNQVKRNTSDIQALFKVSKEILEHVKKK